MRKKSKKIAKIQILLSIASTVLGLIASVVLDKVLPSAFTDTSYHAVLTSIALLAVLVIIGLVTISVFAQANEELILKVDQKQESNILKVNQKLADIGNNIGGLKWTFVQDPPKSGKGIIYYSFTEIIEKAESEILCLFVNREGEHSKSDQGKEVTTPAYRGERENYLDAIVDKLQQKANEDKKFFYKRIIQLPEGKGTPITEERIGKRWYDHFEKVLEILQEKTDAGYLKKSDLFFEQSFLIVDKRHVIFPLDGRDPTYGAFYVEGALIFFDFDQKFVKYLIDFFGRVDANASRINQLPENQSSTQ